MVVGSLGFVLGHGFGFGVLRQIKSLLGHLAVGSLWGFFVMCACDVCLCCSVCVVLFVLFACVVLIVLFCPAAPTLFCLSKIK